MGGKKGNQTNARSTAGWLSSLPVFEPHYQITMAHGLATGWIETDGVRVEFTDAPSYSEKNWGGSGFPSKWFWLQCNSFPSCRGLSVTATGANRGVVVLPGVREEVAAIVVHLPNGEFFPFVPVGVEAAEVSWEVSRWGAWTVTAATATHEVEVSGWIAPGDDAVGGTTVLRAPTDDAAAGMAPLCRESFKGTVRVSLWERDAAATWEGSGGGGTAGWSGGERWGAGGVSWTPWSRTRRRWRWAGGLGRRRVGAAPRRCASRWGASRVPRWTWTRSRGSSSGSAWI